MFLRNAPPPLIQSPPPQLHALPIICMFWRNAPPPLIQSPPPHLAPLSLSLMSPPELLPEVGVASRCQSCNWVVGFFFFFSVELVLLCPAFAEGLSRPGWSWRSWPHPSLWSRGRWKRDVAVQKAIKKEIKIHTSISDDKKSGGAANVSVVVPFGAVSEPEDEVTTIKVTRGWHLVVTMRKCKCENSPWVLCSLASLWNSSLS